MNRAWLLLLAACGGMKSPGSVADKFVDRYYVESDQTGALPFTSGVAALRLQDELRLSAEGRRGGGQQMPLRQIPLYYSRKSLPGAGKTRQACGSRCEDEPILACDKTAGLAIHAGAGITGETLVDEVRAYLERQGLRTREGEFRPSPAHRLDRETSGVVVVAKTRQAMVRLTETFTAGEA